MQPARVGDVWAGHRAALGSGGHLTQAGVDPRIRTNPIKQVFLARQPMQPKPFDEKIVENQGVGGQGWN